MSLLSVALVTIILFGFTTYYLDPLLQYGKEPGNLTSREYAEIYCNPGIAKNYDYDAVLVGSSMVENTDVSEIDRLFDCKTIKVPYSGGSSYNHKTILDVCLKHNNKIKKVFWSLDEYALTTDKNTPRYPLPDYLYDDNKINDLSYLLNLDIFYFYTSKDIISTLKHENQIMMRDGSWAGDESAYCKANALSSIDYPMELKDNKGEKYFENNLEANINQNIMPLIEMNPDTEFIFYMVPYSIIYWYMEKQNGTLDATFYDINTALDKILSYDNTKVYFFQDEKDIITDLDNYKDFSHFKSKFNSWMSNEMARGSNLLTKDNYKMRIENFKSYLSGFDFEGFFKEQYA